MKFRIRCRSGTYAIEMENNADATVGDLKATVLQSGFGSLLGPDIQLSLNRWTALEPEKTLSDVGLVSGDLIYVLQPSNTDLSVSPKSTENMNIDSNSSTDILSDFSSMDRSVDSDRNTSVNHINSGNDEAMSCQSRSEIYKEEFAMRTDEELLATEVEVNRYLKEPMLIRESTDSSLPQSVLKFYDEAKTQSPFGALAVLLKVLMNELGYIEKDRVALVANISSWSDGQSQQMNFQYFALENANFSLLLLPVHKTLFVHGCVQLPSNESLNLKLPISVTEYVSATMSGNACETYQGSNLPKLSRTFKDSIAYPLMQFALEGSGFSAKPHLLTLASELQIAVFKFLDVASLLCLSEVCSHLNAVCKDRAIWRHLFIRDFGVTRISISDLKHDWNMMYKERYSLKKMEEAARLQPVFHPFPGYNPPPILPIGGEYDLYPFYPRHPFNPFAFPGQHLFRPPFHEDPALHPRVDDHLLSTIRPAVRPGHFSHTGRAGHPFRF